MLYTPFVTGDNEEEEALLRDKKIPFLKQQLREAQEKLAQLEQQKATQPAQETDPPRNEAFASRAA